MDKLKQPPTPELVKAFWTYMQQQYGSSEINKQDSSSMNLVADFLDKLKILNKDDFLKRFTTTIGKTIYFPGEIGVANTYYDLWEQISVCTHEHVHVVQYTLDPVRFIATYVADSTARALYEAEAYSAQLALNYWRWQVFFNNTKYYLDKL